MPNHDRRQHLRQYLQDPRPRPLGLEYRIGHECPERLPVARERHHHQEVGKHRPELAEVLALAAVPPALADTIGTVYLVLLLVGVLQIAS